MFDIVSGLRFEIVVVRVVRVRVDCAFSFKAFSVQVLPCFFRLESMFRENVCVVCCVSNKRVR